MKQRSGLQPNQWTLCDETKKRAPNQINEHTMMKQRKGLPTKSMSILWWNKGKGSQPNQWTYCDETKERDPNQINEHTVMKQRRGIQPNQWIYCDETKERDPTKSMNILWWNKGKGSNQINEYTVMKQRKGIQPNQWTYCDEIKKSALNSQKVRVKENPLLSHSGPSQELFNH